MVAIDVDFGFISASAYEVTSSIVGVGVLDKGACIVGLDFIESVGVLVIVIRLAARLCDRLALFIEGVIDSDALAAIA